MGMRNANISCGMALGHSLEAWLLLHCPPHPPQAPRTRPGWDRPHPVLWVTGQVEGNTSVNTLEAVARLGRRAVTELSSEVTVSCVSTPPRPN